MDVDEGAGVDSVGVSVTVGGGVTAGGVGVSVESGRGVDAGEVPVSVDVGADVGVSVSVGAGPPAQLSMQISGSAATGRAHSSWLTSPEFAIKNM